MSRKTVPAEHTVECDFCNVEAKVMNHDTWPTGWRFITIVDRSPPRHTVTLDVCSPACLKDAVSIVAAAWTLKLEDNQEAPG